MTDAPSTPEAGSQPQVPSLRILSQYVKDLSFENPGAPDSMRAGGAPNIDMAIDVQARKAGDDVYEVVLNFNARAVRENDEVVFIAELAFGGLFQLANIETQDREPFLLIECPRLIFPFARRILADVTRDGGFPPLMIDPVDFAQMFQRRMAEEQSKQKAQA